MEKKTRGDQPFKLQRSPQSKTNEKSPNWGSSSPFSQSYSHFNTNPNFHSWIMPQQMMINWFALQQKFWEGYWNLLSWQCWTFHQITMDNTRAMVHAMQLSSEPHTLYRYMRMNWKKPYEQSAANMLTASRLCGQIWADCFLAWQNALHPSFDKEDNQTKKAS